MTLIVVLTNERGCSFVEIMKNWRIRMPVNGFWQKEVDYRRGVSTILKNNLHGIPHQTLAKWQLKLLWSGIMGQIGGRVAASLAPAWRQAKFYPYRPGIWHSKSSCTGATYFCPRLHTGEHGSRHDNLDVIFLSWNFNDFKQKLLKNLWTRKAEVLVFS